MVIERFYSGFESVSLFRSILVGFRGISDEDWRSFTNVTKEIVRCMLDPDPASRISAPELSHSLTQNWDHMRGETPLNTTQARFKAQLLKS